MKRTYHVIVPCSVEKYLNIMRYIWDKTCKSIQQFLNSQMLIYTVLSLHIHDSETSPPFSKTHTNFHTTTHDIWLDCRRLIDTCCRHLSLICFTWSLSGMDFAMHILRLLHPADSFTQTETKRVVPFFFFSLCEFIDSFVVILGFEVKFLDIRQILCVSEFFKVWCLKCFWLFVALKAPLGYHNFSFFYLSSHSLSYCLFTFSSSLSFTSLISFSPLPSLFLSISPPCHLLLPFLIPSLPFFGFLTW